MAQSEREVRVGFGDLWTLLFRRKICPKCGARLVRHMDIQATGPKWQREGWVGLDLWYGDKTVEEVVYRCEPCGLTYTLRQLRLGLPGVSTSRASDDESK
jgi:rubredoxin